MIDLDKIATEKRNPLTMDIDTKDTLSICRIINNEDKKVPEAVEAVLPQIAAAIDGITERMKIGGRLFYIGAGTSGRLGVLDASECPPTYSVSPELVQGIIAGGEQAMFRAKEGIEDNEKAAADDLADKKPTENDTVVGLAASGRTPYVIGGLEYARQLGIFTVSIACCADSAIGRRADIAIEAVTGPEVVTGSTRMKAGTAQKLILNMISTAVMIKLGKVYQNLMVDVHASNLKLQERARHIVMEATGISYDTAAEILGKTSGRVKPAIVMQLLHIDLQAAEKQLFNNGGYIRKVQNIK